LEVKLLTQTTITFKQTVSVAIEKNQIMATLTKRKTKPKAKPADWVIQQRRAQEAKRDDLQATVRYNFLVGSRSHWENKTQKVIEKNRALRRFAELQADARRALDDRRRRLAQKLSREQEVYEQMVERSFPTMEQRNQAMTERALKLKYEREVRQAKAVKEARARQFRGSCDELRGKDKVAEGALIAQSWRDSIIKKETDAVSKAAQQKEFDMVWERDRVAKGAREEEELAKRANWNKTTKDILDQQVDEKAMILAEEKKQAADFAARDIKRWQSEIEEEKRQHRVRLVNAGERYQAIVNENMAIQEKKKGWGDADKAHTKWLLSEAIRKEDEEDARKRTIKEKVRVEAKAYQKQLEEQMIKASENDDALEQLRRDDVEKEWQKKQAVWDREAAARASLQQEVLQTREVQIREKTALKKLEREMDVNWIASQAGKWDSEAAAEKAKQDRKLGSRMKAQEMLLKQIQANEDARARERQQEFFQMRLMKQQEATFDKQLNQMKGEKYQPNDFRKKKAGWFS
jgi:hypothetical protein